MKTSRIFVTHPLLALAIAGLLTACGGGGDEASTETAAAAANESGVEAESSGGKRILAAADTLPGTLRGSTPLGLVTKQAIVDAMVGGRLPPTVPVYDVNTIRLSYMTTDGQGQPILASGLLALPKKAPGKTSPVVSFQHATIFRDAQAPSNNPTGTEPSVVLASLGYIVVAADYVGYGVSKGAPHPYLMSAPTAAAVVDLLTAGLSYAVSNGVLGNGQLFLVGYSEGAYATAAAHRALQDRGGDIANALVGSAPGAGPLDVGASLDELLRRVRDENAALGFLIDPDLLQNLGSSLRRRVRDEMLSRLIPEDADVVFQSTFIDNFLANNRGAINRDSDVYDWRPAKPVRLFHGRDDQTVPFISSVRAQQTMVGRGAPSVLLQECRSIPASHLGCVAEYWTYMLAQMGFVVRNL